LPLDLERGKKAIFKMSLLNLKIVIILETSNFVNNSRLFFFLLYIFKVILKTKTLTRFQGEKAKSKLVYKDHFYLKGFLSPEFYETDKS